MAWWCCIGFCRCHEFYWFRWKFWCYFFAFHILTKWCKLGLTLNKNFKPSGSRYSIYTGFSCCLNNQRDVADVEMFFSIQAFAKKKFYPFDIEKFSQMLTHFRIRNFECRKCRFFNGTSNGISYTNYSTLETRISMNSFSEDLGNSKTFFLTLSSSCSFL